MTARVIPRFRGRLLFPIHDLRGRVVGFGGRLLGPGRAQVSQLARDRRSSTRDASSTTCTRRRAPSGRRRRSSWSRATSTCSGWCSPASITWWRRSARRSRRTRPRCSSASRPPPILLYDSDQAGLRATFRAGDELLRHGVRVRVATHARRARIPTPWCRRAGAAGARADPAGRHRRARAEDPAARARGWFEDVEHRREALDRLLPTIRAATDPITRDLYSRPSSRSAPG